MEYSLFVSKIVGCTDAQELKQKKKFFVSVKAAVRQMINTKARGKVRQTNKEQKDQEKADIAEQKCLRSEATSRLDSIVVSRCSQNGMSS